MRTLLVIFLVLVPMTAFCCMSDYDCGIGNACVKGAYQSVGVCMQVERSLGVPNTTRMPNPNSVYPNMNPTVGPRFCPPGYMWSYQYNTCVR